MQSTSEQRAGKPFRRGWLAAALLAGAAFPAPALDQSPGSGQGPLAEALALLRSAEPDAGERCQERLVDLARSAAPALIGALQDPGALQDERGPLVDGRARRLLVEALQRRPAEELDRLLEASLGREPPPDERLRSVELLGELGGPDSVAPLFELLAGMDPVLRQNATVSARCERALANLLSRHETAYEVVSARAEALDVDLQCTLARGVGRARSGRGLSLLDRLLHRDASIDRAVLEAVNQLDPSDPHCEQGQGAAFAAWFLTAADGEARRLAITALGRHGGAGDCAELIPLLASDEAEIRHAAHWALREISGCAWPTDGATWSRWYSGELTWYRTRCPELLAAALGSDPALAFGALAEISTHGLFRRELAADLETVLLEAETVIAVSACAALARLGGPAGAALLRRASGDRRLPVAEAAARALVSVARR